MNSKNLSSELNEDRAATMSGMSEDWTLNITTKMDRDAGEDA